MQKSTQEKLKQEIINQFNLFCEDYKLNYPYANTIYGYSYDINQSSKNEDVGKIVELIQKIADKKDEKAYLENAECVTRIIGLNKLLNQQKTLLNMR